MRPTLPSACFRPHRRTVFLLAGLLLPGLFAPPALAVDIIVRKGEAPRLSGKIDTITRTEVVIKTGLKADKPEKVPVNQIDHIEWDGAPRTLNTYFNQEAAGRYAEALAGYEKLLKDPSTKNANLKKDLEYFVARVNARLALADPSKVAAAISKLESFRRTNNSSYHYYEALSLLGDLYLASKDFTKAKEVYAELQRAPWKDVQLKARNAEARVLLAEGKTNEALQKYDAVVREVGLDTNLKALRNEATLGKAACLQKTGKHDEALKVLGDVIAKADLNESSVLAEAYLLQGDSYLAKGQTKDALLAYLHVDILFAGETKFHPKALYYLSKLWGEVNKPVRAANAKSRLQTDYPNSEWAKKN